MANEATPIEQALTDATCSHSDVRRSVDGVWLCFEEDCQADMGRLWLKPAQRFFAEIAQSIITPHVGDQYRDTIKNLLLRATEAGLYDPELK